MFDGKNAGGWALALVALGLFLGLMMRDLVRNSGSKENSQTIAAMMPTPDEHVRNVDDLTSFFERVTTQCAPFIVMLQALPPHAPLSDRHGSGVLMSPDGHIITDTQFVRNARQVKITLSNKKSFVGEVLGSDPPTGIAVIKISASGLKGIRQGNSENLRPGQWVVALGNVTADRHAATTGIVSVKGRSNTWLAEAEDFLQTDAVINAHNAGGALVDLQGRLVGINAKSSSTTEHVAGMSTAVPVNMAREVMRRIIAEGKFVRGALGVHMQELDATLTQGLRLQENSGVLVTEVSAEGAASRAGIQRGDVIIKIGEKKVATPIALRELVASTKPGMALPISIMREGAELALNITVEEQHGFIAESGVKPAQSAHHPSHKFGLVVNALTSGFLQERRLPLNTHGIVVSEVLPNSAAELAGIRAGDILQEWDRKSVASVKDYRARVAAAQEGETVMIFIRRGQEGRYCALEISAANVSSHNVLP